MNHKRLAAALLTALALTTLPAMGTAFAEDGVDAYGRPDAAADSAGKSARHRLHHSIRYTGTFGKYG